MKNSLFALCACALCASVAMAAPASKTPAKTSLAKATAKPVAVKTPAKTAVKVAPTVIAQADSTLKPEEMPAFFPDVPRDHWAFAAVQRLAAAGIMNGYPSTTAATPPAMAAKTDDVKVAAVAETTTEQK